jgi:hypothetical protein
LSHAFRSVVGGAISTETNADDKSPMPTFEIFSNGMRSIASSASRDLVESLMIAEGVEAADLLAEPF